MDRMSRQNGRDEGYCGLLYSINIFLFLKHVYVTGFASFFVRRRRRFRRRHQYLFLDLGAEAGRGQSRHE